MLRFKILQPSTYTVQLSSYFWDFKVDSPPKKKDSIISNHHVQNWTGDNLQSLILQPRILCGKWLSCNEWVLHTSSEILIQVEMSFLEKNDSSQYCWDKCHLNTRREGKTDRGREKNAIVQAMVSNATALLDNLSSVKKWGSAQISGIASFTLCMLVIAWSAPSHFTELPTWKIQYIIA